MPFVTCTPDPGRLPWDRTSAGLLACAPGRPRMVMLLSGNPLLVRAPQRPTALSLLQDHGVDPAGLIVVGPRDLGEGVQGGRGTYAALVERGLRVLPAPVLVSREGVPALRRFVAGLIAVDLFLIVDLDGVLATAGSSEALIAVCRSLAKARRRGATELVSVDIVGRPKMGEVSGDVFLDKLFAAALGGDGFRAGIL